MNLLALGWFFQPLHGIGYQFWSGIGSDLGEVTLVGAVLVFLRHRNCHVRRCWRLQWHEHPDNGHPVCRRHHPDGAGIEHHPTGSG